MVTISQPGHDPGASSKPRQSPGIQLASGSLTGTIFDHVVIIMMENEGIFDICKGNPPPCSTTGPAPYMASLANNYTIGDQYLSLINTSQPNYVAMISGSTQGCTSSGCPVITAPNLVDRFESVGLTWRGYFENQTLARGCDLADHEPYTVIHNPFIAFQDITNSTVRCNKIFLANPNSCGSVTDCILVNDLNNATAPAPNFMWLTPNDCHDMRGSSVCGTSSLIGPGNLYLSKLVPLILKSKTFTTTRSALFITFDEGNGFCPLNNSSEDCLYNTWVGPVAKTSFSTTNLYNHYSVTKTIETNWNLASFTTNDANAKAMTEYFKTQPPDFGIAASPTSLALTTGGTANSTITLNSLNNFTGTVTLSRSSSPTGLTLTLNPTSLTLSAGGTATSTLSVSSSQMGSYSATVTGTSNALSHNTNLTISVTPPPNFAITANPNSLTLSHGLSGAASSSTVNSTGDQTFFESSYLATSFYAKGLIWFFYEDSRNTCEHQAGCLTYTTSVNGSKWVPPTTIPVHITDSDFSVTTNGTSIFYVRYNETSFESSCGRKIQFGLGNLSNSGTINWQPEQTVAVGASNRVYVNDEIILNSNGQVWIAYMIDNHSACGGNGTDRPQVIHSAGTDYASWTGNFTLSTAHSSNWHIALVSLGNGQVYASFWLGKLDVHGRLFNSGWQGDEQISSTTTKSDINAWLFNAGTIVYAIYFDNSTETFNLASRSSGGTWTITTIGTGETHTGTAFIPSYYSLPDTASFDATNNQFHLFYMNATNHRIDQWTGSGNSWNKTIGIVSTGAVPYPDGITSFIQSNPITIGVIFYISGTTSPFTVNSAPLTFQSSGFTGSFTVTVTPQSGFTGTVTLSNSTSPSTGLTISCGTTTITGGSGSSLCNLTSNTPGNYTVTVTGVSGTLSHSTTVAVSVPSGADFQITASSPNPVNAGQSPTSTVTVTALGGFTGIVTLADAVPSGLSCGAITPGIIINSGTATVSCTSTVAGNYTLTLTGTSGSLSHSTTAVFRFQDFTTSAANPIAVDVTQSAATTITITAMNHFNGTVNLTDNIPSGLTCASITPSSLIGSGTATVSCSTNLAGNYTLTVTGSSGSLSHSATALLRFQDFTITATSPSPVDTGQSSTSTVTVVAVNGFSGTVTFSITPFQGLSCGSFSPTRTTGSGSSTVSCSATVAGNYTATITGTSAPLVHNATVIFQFRDFTISATSPAPVDASISASSTITVAALNHFTGSVVLSDTVPSGLTCGSISPSSVSGSGTAAVACSASASGNYTLTVTGTSGLLVRTTNAIFRFQDFTLSASSPAPVNAGSSATSTITVVSVNGFAGTVSLNDALPSGLTCGAINPTSLTGSGTATVSCTATVAGNYTLSITGANGTLSHSTTIVLVVQDYSISSSVVSLQINARSNGSSIITIIPLNHFSGTVSLSISATTGLTSSINPTSIPGGSGTATLTFSPAASGNYTVTITGSSGTLTHTTTVSIQAVDFTLVASPTTITIPAGARGNSTVTIAALNGFTGTVSLTLTPSTGLGAAIAPSSITRSGTSTLTASTAASGNYTLMINATSGSLTHTMTVTIHVLDYSLTGNPVNIFAPIGSSTSSTLTIQSLNQYAGNLTLTYAVQIASAIPPAGGSMGGGHTLILAPPPVLPVVSISPQSFQLFPSGTQLSTVSISLPSNLPAGNYLITVMAGDGTLSHQILITLAATDFTITATPTSVSIRPGSNTTIVLNLQSLNFFQGNVTLTVNSPPGGPTGNLSTSIVRLTFNSNINLNLTIKVPANTALGNYTITVQATSGTISHILSIPVRVTSTGFVTIMAKIFSSQSITPISALVIFALLTTFIALKVRPFRKSDPRNYSQRLVQNHDFQRSQPTRHLPYSSGLPLLWGLTGSDSSKI